MKKIFNLLIGFIIIFNTTAFAVSEPQISFTVDGKAKKGEKITINIMAKDISNLYAVSVDYIYNTDRIKVNSIEGASLIKDSKDNKMELGGETDKDGNRANYQMTFTGKVKGVSGSGALVKIEAEVLKDSTIELTEENMKIKLVQIDKDYNVGTMNFNFNSFKVYGNTSGDTGGNIGNQPGEGGGNVEDSSNGEVEGIIPEGNVSDKDDENKGESNNNESVNKPLDSEKKDNNKINDFKNNSKESTTKSIEEENNGDFESANGDEVVKGNNEKEEMGKDYGNKVMTSVKENTLGVILILALCIILIGGAVSIVIKKRSKIADIENIDKDNDK